MSSNSHQAYTRAEIIDQIAPLFSRHNPNGIYLANHSLGRPLDSMQDRMNEFLEAWYGDLDEAWGPWLEALNLFHQKVGDLLGVPEDAAVVLKTSAGQGLRAVLNCFSGKRIRVVTSSLEFDSIDFILRTYEARGLIDVDWVEPDRSARVPLFRADDFVSALPGADLLVLSVVNFTTGQVFPDLERVVREAHHYGCRVLLDCYHSFGVLDMPWVNADYAIGGSYKYVHGGPGACWLVANQQILGETGVDETLDTGWFAKKELFGYARDANRAVDERAWWESTPPVVEAYQALAGLEFLERFGVGRLRSTNLKLQAEMREIMRLKGIGIFEPNNSTEFGAFSLFPTERHKEMVVYLREHEIRADSRNGFVRFGPHPLNTPEEFEWVAEVVAGSGLL